MNQLKDPDQGFGGGSGTGDAAEAEEAPAEGGLITTDYTYDLPLFPDDPDFTFSMWVSFSDRAGNYMPNGFADNKALVKATEMTGVNVDIVSISTSSNSEQFQLRVASNDLPNVITNVAMLWTGSYDAAIEDEVFIDLTEMTENYMPAYKECYDQLPESVKLDLHTDEGNFPRLISINNYPTGAGEGMFVRTDYLEKVGLDIPKAIRDVTTGGLVGRAAAEPAEVPVREPEEEPAPAEEEPVPAEEGPAPAEEETPEV